MSAFRKLAAKYASLGVVVGETAKAAAQDFKKELEQGFSQGKDAYGNSWDPLRAGGASHLRETGAYQASLAVMALPGVGQSLIEMTTGNAANLHAKESYQFPRGSQQERREHRGGGRRRALNPNAGKPWYHPARPLMPIEGQPLPAKWQEIIAKNYADSMKDATK